MSRQPFFVSAPGKVIIFGEHSAVYSKPAIAAAISLRAYLLATPSENEDIITLEFPDIELSHSWNKKDLPWKQVKSYVTVENNVPQVTEELVPEIVDRLAESLGDLNTTFHYTTCLCFLYMYMHLCSEETSGRIFCIRSTLPIGAGLGSSAATSVCLAACLSTLGQHLSEPTHKSDEKVFKSKDENSDFIDKWSLLGEKCFHGNPSGIDNAVATYGGAVMYQRMQMPNLPSVRTTMRNFPPLKLLLTSTKIPRSTAALVGNVSRINTDFPKIAGSILDAMEHIATEAYLIMMRPSFCKEDETKLRELVDINHGLLAALGVSHPALEKIKIIGDEFAVGSTKLTGAGGGGCAITLIKEDCKPEDLERAKKEFSNEGFETFDTSLGGKGVGVLSYSNATDSDSLNIFDHNRFIQLKDRDDILKLVGVESTPSWRFW
ncbi:uncharacterized protein PRCAT00002874001 [Priceomyces carsonii]|uniref:uncharacterized protein n=1 Tax=Priceomyces carsonii TaxID=28549 RepID=UPI002EDA08C4|nr:unnamed protein product [Priceomyces carsonii]